LIIDAGPFIVDGENVNSRLWALIKRATERGEELHTTHPVLAQVWRHPAQQATLAFVAESLGAFILTGDPDDMSRLNARFEVY
jgi:hypothetical protein